uniref:Interferon-induced helicase C domain-containing protein 1 n=1 Tax=Magallana gigas TaxID=29159 RepID=K1QR25_MAGGI
MADHLSREPSSSIDNMLSIWNCLHSFETPKLVELYRPLVVRCVEVNDVVHYLDDVICTREREEIVEIGKQKGSTVAMDYLLSAIDGSSSSDRWTKFVDILNRKGYQYVAKAISGEEVNSDAYRRYKNLLGPLKMDLVEKVNPNDLLCLLESQEKIIEQSDTEHIKAEMVNKGPMAGMIVLLDRIWRKSENWYTSFLNVLCITQYTHLVEKIDPVFALDFDLMESMTKIIGNSLHCLQQDHNLWRFYHKDRSSREKLLSIHGLELNNVSISFFDTNPYSSGNLNPNETTLKIRICGLPLSVNDSAVSELLDKLGCVAKSKILYEKIRHPVSNNMTSVLNGNRHVTPSIGLLSAEVSNRKARVEHMN